MDCIIREGKIEEIKEISKEGKGFFCYPLHMAAFWNQLEIVKFLVQEIDVNQEDDYKKTPLQYAVAHASLEVVEYLIEKGADVKKQDIFGISPFLLARKLKNHSFFRRRYDKVYKKLYKACF